MGMLTKEDLKQIGVVMDEKFVGFEKKVDDKFLKFEDRVVDRIVGEVGEVIEQNINPQFEAIRTRLDGVEATMVTKTYLDEKLGALKGDLIGYDRKLERKTDALIDTLAAHGTLVSPDLERLESSRVFPHSP